MDDEELKQMVLAEKQVEAFLQIMSTRYGLKESDIPDLLDSMKWVIKHRERINKSGAYAFMTLLGLIVTGFALALWEGIKHKLSGHV